MTLDNNSMLGRRVECEGFRGSVLFVGEIEGTGAGSWLGVDWDDVSRGKHDGSYKDMRYFTTREVTSGSFVRPHKVNFGRTCSSAITEQYEPLEEETLDSMQREAVFKANRAQVKAFEYVGFEKISNQQSQHETLTLIDLSNKCINSGDAQLSTLCPNIVELDLRQNLFSSWQDIASVTQYMPSLNILNIGQNRISSDVNENLIPAFKNVEHLIAGKMDWDCHDLLQALKLFPNIKSLEISNNKISNLDSNICNLIPKLEKLGIDNNPINNWDEILKISKFNSLEVLHIQNIGITNTYFKYDSNPFPALKILYVSQNNIDNWVSISALENIKKLEELNFRNNPILNSENFDTNRQIIICRIHQLKILDKIVITDSEKRGAALDYLKKYGVLYLSTQKDEVNAQQFKIEHSCYQRLVEKYGAPEEAELVTGTKKLKNALIALSVICPQQDSKVIQKKFPPNMKIQKLRGLIQKLFNTGGSSLNLSYRCQDNPNVNYEFDNDLKDLAYYSIKDGDEIIIVW